MKMYAWLNDTVYSDARCKAAGAALGLWGLALSWCAAHSHRGHIPRAKALELGSAEDAATLVRVGLWSEDEGSYQFVPSELWAISANNPDESDEP